MKNLKYFLAGALVLIAAVLLIRKDTISSFMDFFNGQSSPSASSPKLTMDKYLSIRDGMSYEQVVAIIGLAGEESGRNKIAGIPGVMESVETVMYQWININGGNMNAMFQNNKLIQKAQFGLK